jgi:hypothetical protein
MLSFFRVNASYQYFSLAIWLIVIGLASFFQQIPILKPELQWMLVGEKMNDGFMIYRDIWDSISPLSAYVYWGIDAVFGRSHIALQVVAALVVLFQGAYFNYVCHQKQLFAERNYVPGALYLLFMNMSFDCTTLSPMLIGSTFLLFAFGTLIRQISREGATDDVFEIGFYLSLAAISYLPLSVFVAWLLVCLLLYTGAGFRHVALAFFGFLLPIVLVLLLFFFRNCLDDFYQNLFSAVVRTNQYDLDNIEAVLLALLVPLGIGILGLFKTVGLARFNNYQNRCQQMMLWWLIVGIFTVFFLPFLAPMQYVWAVAPLAFFGTNFFLVWRKHKWQAEAIFVVMFCWIIGWKFYSATALTDGWQAPKLESLRIIPTKLPAQIVNKRILVIGSNQGEYLTNTPATPYLNWDIARRDLGAIDSYESVINIYDNFTADPPDYIIDKEGVMKTILARLPELNKQYQLTNQKGIYVRK